MPHGRLHLATTEVLSTTTGPIIRFNSTTAGGGDSQIYKRKIDANLESFNNQCKDLETRSFSTVSDLQEKIERDLKPENDLIIAQNRDIMELIALSSTDAHIDFLTDVVRRHALKIAKKDQKNNTRSGRMTFGRFFFNFLVSMKKSEKIVEVIKDRRNAVLLKHHSSTEILLNYLSVEGMNNEIYEVLVERLPKYFRTTYQKKSKPELGDNQKQIISHIPFTHMDIYTKALLDLNSEKAYYTMKEMVDYIYKNDGEVSKHIVLRLMYYSIQMKKGQFGFNIFYTDIFKLDNVLKSNLMTMLHSINGSEQNVILNLKNMFSKNVPIYQYTFKVLRDDIKRSKSSLDFKNHIDLAYRRALRNNLFATKDLTEIVFGTPDDTPELFQEQKDLEEHDMEEHDMEERAPPREKHETVRSKRANKNA